MNGTAGEALKCAKGLSVADVAAAEDALDWAPNCGIAGAGLAIALLCEAFDLELASAEADGVEAGGISSPTNFRFPSVVPGVEGVPQNFDGDSSWVRNGDEMLDVKSLDTGVKGLTVGACGLKNVNAGEEPEGLSLPICAFTPGNIENPRAAGVTGPHLLLKDVEELFATDVSKPVVAVTGTDGLRISEKTLAVPETCAGDACAASFSGNSSLTAFGGDATASPSAFSGDTARERCLARESFSGASSALRFLSNVGAVSPPTRRTKAE